MLIFFFFKQKTAYEMRISDLEFRRVLFRSYALRGSLAALLHLDADTVHVAHVPGAGCYGHNGADDAALDAALVARAIPGRPVLLKWSRADEHAWERSEERRGGQECVRPCRSWWSPVHSKKKKNNTIQY